MTRLVLIRHALTDWNKTRRLQGRRDIPLSDDGHLELSRWALPPALVGLPVYSSPLQRAMQTAQHLASRPVIVDDRLIEMDWGDWEGQRLADLRAAAPDAMIALERQGLDFRPPGGETPRDVQARLMPLCQMLSQKEAAAILVTHRGVMRALYALAVRWGMVSDPPEKMRPDCYHLFDIEAGVGVRVISLNHSLCKDATSDRQDDL